MKYYRVTIAGHSWLSKNPYDNSERWYLEVVEKIFTYIFNEKPIVEEITEEQFENKAR